MSTFYSKSSKKSLINDKILVVVHLYYTEMWPELRDCLKNIKQPYDLYVTIVFENKQLKEEILNFNSEAHFEVVENKGYDIGPFIHILNKVNLDDYSYIIKLHTKRDIEKGQGWFRKLDGSKWRERLLEFIKTPENFEKSLKYLSGNKKVGMVSSVHTIVDYDIYDKEPIENTKQWLKEHNFPVFKYSYVAGTMFIARASIFKNIQNLKISIVDFPNANEEHQCQLAHIFERLFGYFTNKDGYRISDPNHSVFAQKIRQKIYQLENVIRFLFQFKITKSGCVILKICKIPVFCWRKQYNG